MICEGTPKTTRGRDPTANLLVGLADEVGEHLLGGVEVGDDAVANRPHGPQAIRRAPEHLPGIIADGFDCPGLGVEGDERGLVDDDPSSEGEDTGVGCAEIDGEVGAEACE